MQFGLWFEPEMVNPDSDLARAHPEWIMAARAEWPIESRYQQVLNLGIPEAYEHVKGQILAVLDEYAIDYVKWDHNRDLIEAGNQRRRRPARRARADPGLLPAAGRDPRRRTRRWRSSRARPAAPGSTSACWSGPTGSGSRTTSTRTTGSDAALDHPADPAGVHGLAHRLGPLAHHRPPPRPGFPGRHRDLRPPRRSSGTCAEATDGGDCRAAAPGSTSTSGERGLLLGGDLVRMDGSDHRTPRARRRRAGPVPRDVRGGGDRQPLPGSRPRGCKLRGLDPEATYFVEPVFPGTTPSGLLPPEWWGQPTAAGQAIEPTSLRQATQDDVIFPVRPVTRQRPVKGGCRIPADPPRPGGSLPHHPA